jgi:hypothetical protein
VRPDESILPSEELRILWRLAARPEEIGEMAGNMETRFQITRPEAFDQMRRLAIGDIAVYKLTGAVTKAELLVLLRSDLPRVRELALRLAPSVS